MSYASRHSSSLPNTAFSDFVQTDHFRLSAEWAPVNMAGVTGPNPTIIYPRKVGLIPNYAGHVPGEAFTEGLTYGRSTVNAKRWLELHKD